MRKEATLEQWKDLYDISIKLKALEPWLELGEFDFITIENEENGSLAMCSILGNTEEGFSIKVYEGAKAIDNIFTMLDSPNIPEEQKYRYENFLICSFASREKLSVKDRDIIKKLGYKFRGENNWIYFRSFEPPYMPYFLSEAEVIRLTETFKQLYSCIDNIMEGRGSEFSKGKILLRRYDNQEQLWINCQEALMLISEEYPWSNLQDELLLRKLQKTQRTSEILEIDIAILSSFVKNKTYDKPYYVSMGIILERSTLNLDAWDVFGPADTEESRVKQLHSKFIEYILSKGRPEEIKVRDKKMAKVFEDFCNKLDIRIDIAGTLPDLDSFVKCISGIKF